MKQRRKLLVGVGLIILVIALYNLVSYRYFGFGWSWQSCSSQGYGLGIAHHTWLRWLLAAGIGLLVGIVAWLLLPAREEAVSKPCAACGRALQAGWLLCPFCGYEWPEVRTP